MAGMMQMRPDLSYIDRIHEKEKSLKSRIDAEQEKEETGFEVEEEARMIQVVVKLFYEF
jgi:hypothetical protein